MKRRTNVPSPVDSLVTQVEQLQQTDSSVEDGEMVWCRATQCLWVYRQNSGLTPDGITVVAALYGNGGVWQRLTEQAASGVVQTAWFIDPVNGNDGNSGLTSATALKTTAERRRRWGTFSRIAAGAKVTVTYLSTVPASDAESYATELEPGAGLTLLGTMVPSTTGTFTAVQTANVGAQQSWAVTDTVGGLGAADVGKIIRITSGPRVGAYARIMANLGGNQVRTTPFGTFAVSFVVATAFAVVTPLIGDAYEVVTPTTVPFGNFNFYGFGNAQPVAGPTDAVVIDSLNLSGNFIGSMDFEAAIFLARTIVTNTRAVRSIGSVFFCGGGQDGLRLANTSIFHLIAIGSTLGVLVLPGANATFELGCVMQNCQTTVDGTVIFGDISVWDRASADSGIVINADGTAITQSPSTIWGTGNAGHGVVVRSGGKFTYTVKPTVNSALGAGRESQIGGTDKQWGAVPFVEPLNNAMIVVNA